MTKTETRIKERLEYLRREGTEREKLQSQFNRTIRSFCAMSKAPRIKPAPELEPKGQ